MTYYYRKKSVDMSKNQSDVDNTKLDELDILNKSLISKYENKNNHLNKCNNILHQMNTKLVNMENYYNNKLAYTVQQNAIKLDNVKEQLQSKASNPNYTCAYCDIA